MPSNRHYTIPPVAKIESLLADATPFHRPASLWRSKTTESEILRGSLNIISVPDRKELIGQSLTLAREITRAEVREKDPWPYNPEEVTKGQRVLYINCFTDDFHISNEIMGLWPGAQEWSVRRDKFIRENPAARDQIHLYHVSPGGFMEQWPEIQKQVKEKMSQVVILNSFEFACRTARHRDDLVFAMLALREMGCTVIVFTQEEKRKIEKQARGPLVLLRMQCDPLLDKSIFSPLDYAEPVGSTHPDDETYWKATGQSGAEYFRQLGSLIAQREAKKQAEEKERADHAGPEREFLPPHAIEDTITDDIELPNVPVEGAIYNLNGEVICTTGAADIGTRNTYTIHQNSYTPQRP